MTGFYLFKRVCSLLGCQDLAENPADHKATDFCSMVNQIADDLKLNQIESLTDEINLKPNQREALIYGCAMLFAVYLRDGGCAKMYTQLYNSKRSAALCSSDNRLDVLPSTLKGGE